MKNNKTNIAYTIGCTKSYNEGFQTDPDMKKIGRSENYEGGCVWRTKEEAQAFIWSDEFLKIDWGDGKPRYPENFSVYGLILSSWEEDVDSIRRDDNKYHLLLNDSKLFKLE